jgi:hypothetical protein
MVFFVVVEEIYLSLDNFSLSLSLFVLLVLNSLMISF